MLCVSWTLNIKLKSKPKSDPEAADAGDANAGLPRKLRGTWTIAGLR